MKAMQGVANDPDQMTTRNEGTNDPSLGKVIGLFSPKPTPVLTKTFTTCFARLVTGIALSRKGLHYGEGIWNVFRVICKIE